nr:PREDICTED: uncharacterized protein LOC103279723 [Anolis carolinensis]|eukprot:XP_008114451.1 PREDICTED: uncharacterized protein LOC103279723 [Anolis carolinensis]
MPSYIKDTTHFINIIESLTIPTNSILMTMDITSLYTNIPLDEARTVIKELLDTRNPPAPPTHFLMDLLDIVLENNYFRCKSQFFLQIFGVTMGSPVAPALANLYIASMEENLILNTEKNNYLPEIIYYGRFIDDIFMVIKSLETAILFSQWINTLHEHIKFSSHSNQHEINFLDITVYKMQDKLRVINYCKPTDKNSILHYTSFHHHKLKTNLPFSQLMRLKCNTSSPWDFEIETHTFKKQFQERGYPSRVINIAIRKVNHIDRSHLLRYSPKTYPSRIIWPLRLTQFSSNICEIVKKHWHMIKEIPGCQNTPMVAYKRTKNFKDMLIRSDFISPTTHNKSNLKGHTFCGHCDVCVHSLNTKQFTHPTLRITIPLNSFTTCATDQVIYVLQCECNLLYVGMTTRSVRSRILEHRSRIKKQIQ